MVHLQGACLILIKTINLANQSNKEKLYLTASLITISKRVRDRGIPSSLSLVLQLIIGPSHSRLPNWLVDDIQPGESYYRFRAFYHDLLTLVLSLPPARPTWLWHLSMKDHRNLLKLRKSTKNKLLSRAGSSTKCYEFVFPRRFHLFITLCRRRDVFSHGQVSF